MGRLLGWSRRKRAAETRRYLDLVAAEQIGPAYGCPACGGRGAGRGAALGRGGGAAGMAAAGEERQAAPLLTFRLDQEQRQRLKARLAREGRTMSEVVTHGLRQYVQGCGPGATMQRAGPGLRRPCLGPLGRGLLGRGLLGRGLLGRGLLGRGLLGRGLLGRVLLGRGLPRWGQGAWSCPSASRRGCASCAPPGAASCCRPRWPR